MIAKDEAYSLKDMNANPRKDECFGTCVVFRTVSDNDKTTGEGVEQTTFLSCDEMKVETSNMKVTYDTPRVDECFRTCIVLGTSSHDE